MNQQNIFNWYIVMKNGHEIGIKHPYNNLNQLCDELFPKAINTRSFTIAELINPDTKGNTMVCINGEEISHIFYKAK